jgi:hypothetical protein
MDRWALHICMGFPCAKHQVPKEAEAKPLSAGITVSRADGRVCDEEKQFSGLTWA